MSSLRSRLLLAITVCTVLIWTAMAVLSYQLERRQLHSEFDLELSQGADLVLDIVNEGLANAALDQWLKRGNTPAGAHREDWAFQARNHGEVMWQSDTAPAEPLKPLQDGCGNVTVDKLPWRRCTRSAGDWQVAVAEPLARRDASVRAAALQQTLPILLFLPLLLLASSLAIKLALRPIQRLSDELDRRAPHRLEPVELEPLPVELESAVTTLNRLLGQLAAALERESSFTANAAHEIRTPLAAIRTQVEVARSTAGTEQVPALDRVLQGVDRLSHLLNQLLSLSRIEHGGLRITESVDLRELCQEVCDDLQPAAQARPCQLQLLDGPAALVPAERTGLRMALENLVRNALRYAPAGSSIDLDVRPAPSGWRLCVSDQGPGMSAAQMRQASRRFYRAPDAQGSGSGLGLAIVERIASLHHGELQLQVARDGQGLRACLLLPATTSS